MQAVERPEENISEKEVLPQVTAFSAAYNSSLHPPSSLYPSSCTPKFAPPSLHPPACTSQLAPPSLHPFQLAPLPACTPPSLHPPACILQVAAYLQVAASLQVAACSLQPPSYTVQLAASSSHPQPSLDRKHPTYGFTLWTIMHSFLEAVIFSTCSVAVSHLLQLKSATVIFPVT